jgi:DNA modification methylase
MGDTYGGSGMGMSYAGQTKGPNSCITDKLLSSMPRAGHSRSRYDKCLLMIPFRFAIEMVNRNWILRNVLIWHKPNCMPASVRDRFTVDFEYLFLFVKSRKYYFEQQFEPWTDTNRRDIDRAKNNHPGYKGKWNNSGAETVLPVQGIKGQPAGNPVKGRNTRSVLNIPTKPFKEAHFAVFPEALVEIPIKAGCPEQVCKRCCRPREKIMKPTLAFGRSPSRTKYDTKTSNAGMLSKKKQAYRRLGYESLPHPVFVGYTDCGCRACFRPGVVLDPFIGSGTTALVAKKLGRDFIGIDLNPGYCRMARKRIAKCRKGVLLSNMKIFHTLPTEAA